MFKNKNYKIILGVIVGIIISVSVVYAASYVSSNIIYDSTNSSLSTGDVQGAIDDLADRIYSARPTTCPEGYYCAKYKTTASELELGDYISYTPTVTSYPTDTTYTGYGSSQTINPSELNLWRVLNKNDDGSVEIISEYVSSTDVYFKGQTGYLNTLAKQYETEGITSGSRHFGYNGQTEYLDPSKVQFTNPPPFTSSTSDNSNEDKGGGDTLYEQDYNDVNTVLGTRKAYKVGTTTATYYWMASRFYYYDYYLSSDFHWSGRSVSTSGSSSKDNLYNCYDGSFSESSNDSALRPIVTLKSGLEYSGFGTKDNPVEIITS